MSKIRKVYYFDKKNAQEMISFLNNSANDTYINRIMFNPLIPLHHLLPLRLKFLPEAYILKDGKEIKGLITIAPTKSFNKQFEIQKLLFEENHYEDASELIQYVVSKYKALGAVSFVVKVDDYLPELIKLFIMKCGFSQISYEKLWKINHINNYEFDKKQFRLFRNSDAPVVTNIYNESLLPHFRPLLSKQPIEFKDALFKGLSYISEYKYVVEDSKSKNICAYISIKTSDNNNYVIDITKSNWTEIETASIISFACSQIKKRKHKANIFIKTKKYIQLGEQFERDLLNEKYECIQNQVVLTNSSAKIIKNNEGVKHFSVLNRLYIGIGAIN